jgi:hypothetical protein
LTAWRSNCLVEALRHYWALRLAGVRVAMWWRRSDARWSPFHCGWQIYDAGARVYRSFSFKPVAPELDVPLWRAWTRLWFLGHIVEGDDPP